jgi:hypothetical protein
MAHDRTMGTRTTSAGVRNGIQLDMFPDDGPTSRNEPPSKIRQEAPIEINSRKEKAVRRARIKSSVSVVTIKRVIAAAQKAGMTVGGLEVRPDGAVRVTAIAAEADRSVPDIFAEWADRL